MSYLTTLLSPLNLLFLVVVIGLLIGKIRIKGISVGIAGILFASIFVGFLMKLLICQENSEIIMNAQSTLRFFSKLGTSLFVSVIGLQTGFSIKNGSKAAVMSFVIGALMSISGVLVMLVISWLDPSISRSLLLGTLCGALTSTPGLSSVCEWMGSGGDDAVLGYGSSYLLGVILVVFVVQVFPSQGEENNFQIDVQPNVKSKIYPELILICLVALLGNVLGSIRMASLALSFGTTAGTLIAGLLIGYIFFKTSKAHLISVQCLNIFKTLGLALFFAGTGFSTGLQAIIFDVKTILYGVLITFAAIACGWILCKFIGRKYPLHTGFIIAGGMTSSPAYSTLSNLATELSINCFSFSYFGALFSLMSILPMLI